MPKPSKSSATSGTRKKHARKAATEEQIEPQQPTKSKPTKKQIKKGLAPPPKKTYIPPSKLKPTAHENDPLDRIDSLLPSELVLILRRFSKKDAITKTRALEELENWIQEARNVKDDTYGSTKRDSLLLMLPVWLYRYPALTIHSSRRIRHLAATVQALLIDLLQVKAEIVAFIDHQGSESDVTRVLGCWCLSRWDIDKSIATQARTSWNRIIRQESLQQNVEGSTGQTSYIFLDTPRMVNDLLPFLITCIMDPSATYLALYPSSTSIPPPNFRGNQPHSKIQAMSKASAEPVGRGEEEQESLEDRNARIRISALHALGWVLSTSQPSAPVNAVLLPLLSSPTFWTILYHNDTAPYLPKQDGQDPPMHFGTGQPAVRRAGWNIINSLFAEPGLPRFLGWINEPDVENASLNDNLILKLISCVVLRSAFVEPDSLVRSVMWQPLLVYLTKVDNAWRLSSDYERSQSSSLADDSENESDHGAVQTSNGTHIFHASYSEFQLFLSLGCNGSPVQGYPTILVILSTIPSEMLPFTIDGLSGFFDSLWSAVDGQALGSLSSERVKAAHAFIAAWSECLLWIIGKLIKGSQCDPSIDEAENDSSPLPKATIAEALVDKQFERFLSELWSGLRVEAEVTGQILANTLQKLDVISNSLLHKAWSYISDRSQQGMKSSEERTSGQTISLLAALHRHNTASNDIRMNIQSLVTAASIDTVSVWNDAIQEGAEEPVIGNCARLLQQLLECFGDVLGTQASFLEVFDNLLSASPVALVSQPSLVLAHLKYSESERRDAAWTIILRTLGLSSLLSFQTKSKLLNEFIHSDQRTLQLLHEPDGQELITLAEQILDEALTGDQSSLGLIITLLRHPKPFISVDGVRGLILGSVMALDYQLQPMIHGSTPSIEILISSLKLLLELGDALPVDDLPPAIEENTLPHLFVLGFILPECGFFEEQEEDAMDLSKRLWQTWQTRAKETTRSTVLRNTERCLKSLITDTRSRPQPSIIIDSLKFLAPNLTRSSLLEMLPTEHELLDLLSSTPADPIDESLAVLDFFASSSRGSKGQFSDYDHFGFSPYCRGVRAWIYAMLADRQLTRMNIWALQHILILGNFATETLQVPHIPHPVFSKERIAVADLKETVESSRRIAAYILASAGEASSWHSEVIRALSGGNSSEQLDFVGQFVYSLLKQLRQTDTLRESKVLYTVLQHVLPNADKTDADGWIDIARQIEPQAFRTSLVISRAVSEFAPECTKLDRYRNELASKLSAVSPSKANINGLRLLRSLAAVAPHAESDVIFLPQQRAVYVVQTLQNWFGSDEDIDEAVEREATLVLYYLAPLLQSIQGSHWEFVFDLLENNLENCSFEDTKSLVLLARSLQLTNTILDLAKSNKYLRGVWNERSGQIFSLVKKLLETPTGFLQGAPVSTCREYALAIIQELPSSLMNENTLSNMCHLLKDSSVENQKLAYFLLQQAAIKRTEHLVVEAAVETQDSDLTTDMLPLELLASLQLNVGLEDTNIKHEEALSCLLAWLLCFDLFIDASLKVKTAYVDHMRKLDLIGLYFLPNIFGILNVADSSKVFKLEPWIIDEYWLPMYDAEAPYSLQMLAAHVYYRGLLTVPSLIRTWWEGLKDRQLSSAIASYTSLYFSPVLVASEFGHLKPSTRAEAGEDPLGDDVFKIRVAHATNEVTASFLVDEQQMEIRVKLPPGYPLRTVEVRPIRRVGVDEKMWRRWLFAVQQVMTTHNGRIVDGLALFKKTVSLHFEGQAECAICYSILHVVNRDLPTKPCRTCKNRFHAGCLYKWFNTSHSSSCPLCRSDIM